GMSTGLLVLVFTSIVDTVPLRKLVTKAALPSGVTATTNGPAPTPMSTSLVLVFTSIADTVSLSLLATKAVVAHRPRAGIADTPSGTTPTSAPANPSTTTPRAHGKRRIATSGPSPATRRAPDQLREGDGDVVGVLGPGFHVDSRHRAALPVGDIGGLAVGCDRHTVWVRADGDVVGVLGSGLHVNGRHGAAGPVGDEGGLAVGRDRHP